MDQLDTFIAEIIEAKNLPGLTDEVKSSLVEDMKSQLFDQVDRALLEELTDEQLDEFNERMEQDTSETVPHDFLVEHGVDIERVTARTMLEFRDLYLESPKEHTEA